MAGVHCVHMVGQVCFTSCFNTFGLDLKTRLALRIILFNKISFDLKLLQYLKNTRKTNRCFLEKQVHDLKTLRLEIRLKVPWEVSEIMGKKAQE